MWFCFNDAFVSVVVSDRDPNLLMVRARAYEHLSALFPKTLTGQPYTIHITPENDYRYRVYCTKDVWVSVVANRIYTIDYTNFKNSVKSDKLHKMYEEFWFLHMIYQNGKKWWKKQQKQWAKHFAEQDKDAANTALEKAADKLLIDQSSIARELETGKK